MRRGPSSALLVAATVAAISCGTPKVDVAAEADAVRTRSKTCAAAEAARDVDGAVAFFAQDAIVQPADATQLRGHEAIAEMYHQWFQSGFKELSGTTLEVTVSESGDLAYEYGINRTVLAGPEGNLVDVGKYLLVWKKIDGEWLIVALSFSSDAPAPTPVSEQ